MIMQLSRRQWLIGALATSACLPLPKHAIADPVMNVAKTRTCGCCQIWVKYLKREGFSVKTENMTSGQLMQFKIKHGVRPDIASCHTARIGGYTLEGHVPVREIRRLLTEEPDAIGLTVPGMPLGSPGMDFGPDKEPYDVLLIGRNGKTTVYASYGKKG